MYKSPQWGTVNLGVDVLQGHGEQSQPGMIDYEESHPHAKGKQQYNPGRNQELNIPPDRFRMQKDTDYNPYGPDSKMTKFSVHERIKELLGEGWPRNQAIIQARQEAEKADAGDVGTINQKDVYRHKYQAEQPSKKISPFSEQVQGYPFI
jgi:hypothetical protein